MSATDRGTDTAPVSDEVDELKKSFTQLRADVVDLFGHVFGLGKSGAEAARGSASDAMENLKSKLNDLKDRGSDQVASVCKKVEENPMASAMIAFGVGFLLAKMMHRRR
jgi:ElaB/YqjD/DUF883 family membrane-anchored ribosome-binding protein